jgi:DNA-binding IscR family transcriptional regulator
LQLCQALGIPSQLACQVLGTLVTAKLVVEVTGEETAFSPARPIEKITVEDILCALRAGQGTELATADDPARAVLREEYERVVLAEMHAANSMTLQNLVVRAGAMPHKKTEAGETLPHVAPAAA